MEEEKKDIGQVEWTRLVIDYVTKKSTTGVGDVFCGVVERNEKSGHDYVI